MLDGDLLGTFLHLRAPQQQALLHSWLAGLAAEDVVEWPLSACEHILNNKAHGSDLSELALMVRLLLQDVCAAS